MNWKAVIPEDRSQWPEWARSLPTPEVGWVLSLLVIGTVLPVGLRLFGPWLGQHYGYEQGPLRGVLETAFSSWLQVVGYVLVVFVASVLKLRRVIRRSGACS